MGLDCDEKFGGTQTCVKAPPPPDYGDYCDDYQPCVKTTEHEHDALVCIDHQCVLPRLVGEHCVENFQCATQNCTRGYCGEVRLRTPCDPDMLGACGSDKYCDYTRQMCVPGILRGYPCTANMSNMCVGQSFCLNGVCVPQFTVQEGGYCGGDITGTACQAHLACRGGICTNTNTPTTHLCSNRDSCAILESCRCDSRFGGGPSCVSSQGTPLCERLESDLVTCLAVVGLTPQYLINVMFDNSSSSRYSVCKPAICAAWTQCQQSVGRLAPRARARFDAVCSVGPTPSTIPSIYMCIRLCEFVFSVFFSVLLLLFSAVTPSYDPSYDPSIEPSVWPSSCAYYTMYGNFYMHSFAMDVMYADAKFDYWVNLCQACSHFPRSIFCSCFYVFVIVLCVQGLNPYLAKGCPQQTSMAALLG